MAVAAEDEEGGQRGNGSSKRRKNNIARGGWDGRREVGEELAGGPHRC